MTLKPQVVLINNTNNISFYIISVDGRTVGMLEKYHDVPTETHPWKAFTGCGHNSKFLGSFYQHEGGKSAAIKAVLDELDGQI